MAVLTHYRGNRHYIISPSTSLNKNKKLKLKNNATRGSPYTEKKKGSLYKLSLRGPR